MFRTLAALALLTFAVFAQAAELSDGTLLFLENCSSVVEHTTHGEIAHVAILFRADAQQWIYEATPAKVRRVKIDEYLLELARLNDRRKVEEKVRVLALAPSPRYSTNELARMRAFVDNQLGRRYSVKNYLRGKPYDGIHCAELTAKTLNASGRFALADCHKLNPQSLYNSIVWTHGEPQILRIPSLEAPDPWLTRMQRTSLAWCTWCRWFGREAWLFLW
jgi:hypothetical protein